MANLHSKRMLDLILDIRKAMPSEAKSKIKFSNPNILDLLVEHHQTTNDETMKVLIEELMLEAGTEWKQKLSFANKSKQQEGKPQSPSTSTQSKKIIYRGQITYS